MRKIDGEWKRKNSAHWYACSVFRLAHFNNNTKSMYVYSIVEENFGAFPTYRIVKVQHCEFDCWYARQQSDFRVFSIEIPCKRIRVIYVNACTASKFMLYVGVCISVRSVHVGVGTHVMCESASVAKIQQQQQQKHRACELLTLWQGVQQTFIEDLCRRNKCLIQVLRHVLINKNI